MLDVGGQRVIGPLRANGVSLGGDYAVEIYRESAHLSSCFALLCSANQQ